MLIIDYYNDIKKELIDNEINKKVKNYSINKSDLNTYYNVGKMLSKAGKHYGESIINKYSIKLTSELGKGYTQTRLKYYRRFFEVFSKRPTLSDKLSYSHYCEIIWLSENEINYYIKISIEQNLSVRQLREKVKSKEYERLPNETKNNIIKKKNYCITDFVKNPINIKNNYNYEVFSEKVLQKLILEDVEHFLYELGTGFTFVKSEYPIKLGDKYNYIDLLLFNYEYNSFVVIELKVTELKKEHIGQLQVYMNYIDKNLKKFNQDTTIGIIICKKNNNYVIEYCSDKRIISRKYKLV